MNTIRIGVTPMGEVVIITPDKTYILTLDAAQEIIRQLGVAVRTVCAPKDGRVH